MKTRLTAPELVTLASMLFGLFFGAGNLIFPLILGATAGQDLGAAMAGMIVTAVGLPLMGIVAIGVSRSEGLFDLASKVSKRYAFFFTCALYLTIGPLFAIPRCAATSFSIALPQFAGQGMLPQALFSLAFFLFVLFFSLKPTKLMDVLGKFLNPFFLVLLGIILVVALFNPLQAVSSVPVSGSCADGAFFAGFLQGYDTLDALASLAFGIIVVQSIRSKDVTDPAAVGANTVRAGAFAMTGMALIYIAIAVVGAQSYGLYADRLAEASFTGGDAFAIIAQHYFGGPGQILLGATVTLCCLKTAIGLVTSCSETFVEVLPFKISYKVYAVAFTVISFVISNVGLAQIISLSAPVLYFLYPLAIVLILLGLFNKFVKDKPSVYRWTIGLTVVAAVADFIRASGIASLEPVVDFIAGWLPFYTMGLGWIAPAAIGLVIGLVLSRKAPKDVQAA